MTNDPFCQHETSCCDCDPVLYDMDAARDQAIRDCIEAVAALKPLLTQDKHEGGYDCCGCSTIDDLHSDSINALRALLEGEQK